MRRFVSGVVFLCVLSWAWGQGLHNQEDIISAEQEEFLRRSQESYRLGKNDDALKWASRAIAADQTNYVGYERRALLNDALRRFDAAVADYTKAHAFNPRNIHLVRLRAQSHFRSGRLLEAIKDWETYRDLEPEPEKTLKMFQLGIAYAVAGRYREGQVFFIWFNIEDSEDVEAAAWHYLCVALGAGEDGIANAQRELLLVEKDKRLPMMQVYEMLKGNLGPADVLAAARSGEPSMAELKQRLFYAHLYIGVYHLAQGREWVARSHLTRAAGTWDLAALKDPTFGYMSDVALVFNARLEKKSQRDLAAAIAASPERVWADQLTKAAWVWAGILLVYLIVRLQPQFRPRRLDPVEPIEFEEEDEDEDEVGELVAAGGGDDDELLAEKGSTTDDD